MYTLYSGIYDRPCGAELPTFNALSLSYWERSLFQRLQTRFLINGLPKASPSQYGWDRDAFYYQLFRCGYVTVFNSKTYGLVPQPATPYGFGLQYQPVGMTIASRFFNFTRPLIIGRECEVIKLTPDFRGIWDIINKYANELMMLDIAIRQASKNARFTYAVAVENDRDKKTIDAIMEKLANGEDAIAYNAKLGKKVGQDADNGAPPWHQFDRDLKQNFLLPELLEARRTVLTDFYREIGVEQMPEKKERMITSEVSANKAETYTRTEVWYRCLKESMERVNALYGTTFSVIINDPKGGEPSAAEPDNRPTGD